MKKNLHYLCILDEAAKKEMWGIRARIEGVGWTYRVMLHEFLRFNVVGVFNSSFALVLYELLYWVDLWPSHTAVAAWAVSSAIGNVEAHFMHYKFTFNSTFSYLRSLNRAFWTYSGQLVVTTAFHYLMVEVFLLHHTFAWFVNTCIFGYINFLLIRWIAFPPEYDKENIPELQGLFGLEALHSGEPSEEAQSEGSHL